MSDPIRSVKGKTALSYSWTYGPVLESFFGNLSEERRMTGRRCPQCKGVLVPPVEYCNRCTVQTDPEPVEVSDRGVLVSYSIVYLPFPSQPTDPPYAYGLILLDGADTLLNHLVREVEPNKIYCGMRVEAVWADERHGDLKDIRYFRPEGVTDPESD